MGYFPTCKQDASCARCHGRNTISAVAGHRQRGINRRRRPMSVGATVTVPGRLTTRRAWRVRPAAIVSAVLLVLLYSGWHFPTERYITPQRGFGYALGILGGSMMLLLFMYSARKR